MFWSLPASQYHFLSPSPHLHTVNSSGPLARPPRCPRCCPFSAFVHLMLSPHSRMPSALPPLLSSCLPVKTQLFAILMLFKRNTLGPSLQMLQWHLMIDIQSCFQKCLNKPEIGKLFLTSEYLSQKPREDLHYSTVKRLEA